MNYRTRLIAAAVALAAGSTPLTAQAPDGYYSSCEGKSGQELLSALYSKITDHTTISYDGLWDVFKTSDVRDDGTVWDMYSTKHWVVGQQHCGNYKVVGDCLNREHSFPKSWFDDRSPMYSDAYHLYPTDGKVNGQRSNYPFGECEGGTTLASNGSVKPLGRLGTSTFPGYTGKVFEPDDEYKGDFARSYFYMAACYYNRIAGWSSPMLASNNYPAFSSWAVDLLMKWHRQDPVSPKEVKRNNEVSKHQKNRNPFIDYPTLADHIWGDKKNVPWSAAGEIDPVITAPIDGSTIDMGVTAVNRELTKTITVKGAALDSDVSVSVSGEGLSASPATLSKTAATGDGAELTLTYLSSAVGSLSGTLTLVSGDARSVVSVTAKAMDGIPVGEATSVSDCSFVANWMNIDGPDATYQLDVRRDGLSIAGYPLSVAAAAESYEVTGLEHTTTYTYTLSCGSVSSQTVTVTTGQPLPSIQFLFDGDLYFATAPGVPSEPAEVLLDIDNIDTDITISVSAPFEVSGDKTSWAHSMVLDPEEDRFYLRVNSDSQGEFTTSLEATAGDYSADVEVSAVVSMGATFIEGFDEDSSGLGNYSGGVYHGLTGDWELKAAGIYAGNSEPCHSDYQSVRFGKTAEAHAAMSFDKTHGLGQVSFWARKWNNDAPSVIEVHYSLDGGGTWEKAGEVTCAKEGEWEQFVVTVNKAGNGRVKIVRPAASSSSRLNLDDVAITDYAGSSSVADLDYHSWDAYCRGGSLVIENLSPGNLIRVYSIDGITRYEGRPAAGELTLSLPDGLYIVVCDDFSRRVLVK